MKNKGINLTVLVITFTAFACISGMANARAYASSGNYTATPSGPYYHQIYSATSTDGINWTVDDTLLFDHASVPGAVYFDNKVYLYYVNAEDLEHEKLSVGISEDKGMTFTVHDVQISGSNSPYPVDPNPIIDGGQIRLTYLGNFNQGETNKIVTATSSDGINFSEEAVIFTGDVYDPDLFYDEVDDQWVLFLNTGGLTKATASSPSGPFTEDPDFSWTSGSISSTHKIGEKYYTYYAGDGICVAEYLNGSLSNIADGIVDFPGLTADPTVAVFGPNDYKMFFKTQVEGGGGEEGDWIKEDGIRIQDGSVPYVLRLDSGMYRVYYSNPDGIFSGISEDGINFTKENGVRLSGTGIPGDPECQVHGATVVRLDDGSYRMYYVADNGGGGPGYGIHRIYSAISSDGLNFTGEGVRIESEGTIDNGWASVPEIVRTFDGRYRLYYCTGAEGILIASAISDDGLDFTREYGPGIGDGTGVYGADPAVCKLPDGTYWMFFTSPGGPMPPWNLEKGIYSARSTDGVNFTKDPGVRVSPGGVDDSLNTYDPTVIALPDGGFRMYYGGESELGVVMLSAISPEENNPPNTPSDPSPADQATGVSINADLSWTGGDPDVADTVTYDVYFGTSASPPLVSNDQVGTTCDPGTLSYNTKYYWKVVATDNHAASTTGPVWDFTTVSPPSDEDNPDVATGLASLGDKLVVAYGYKASEGGWTWYNPSWPPGANTLTTLYVGRGYWINVSEACDLVYGTNTYELDADWNLIAWLGG